MERGGLRPSLIRLAMKSSKLHYHLTPVLFGVWLWTLYVSRLFTLESAAGGDKPTLFAAISWPLLVIPLYPPLRKAFAISAIRDHRGFFTFFIAYGASNALSVLMSAAPTTSAGYFGGLAVCLVVAYAFNLAMDGEQLRRGLVIFSVIGLLVLGLIATTTDLAVESRLGGIINPNLFAAIAMSVIMSALLLGKLRFSILIMAPVVVLLFMTNSRTSLTALVVGVTLWLLFRANWSPNIGTVTYVACLLALGFLVLYLTQERMKDVLRFISGVYALDDPARGLGTGGTGRWDAWKEAWRLFLANPWFGVGFKMHEPHMLAATSAHNGYLVLLCEQGAFGTSIAAYFVMRGTRRMAARATQMLEGWVTAYLGACFFVAIFESMFLNVGVPNAQLMIVLLVRGFLIAPAVQRVRSDSVSYADRFWGAARQRVVPAPAASIAYAPQLAPVPSPAGVPVTVDATQDAGIFNAHVPTPPPTPAEPPAPLPRRPEDLGGPPILLPPKDPDRGDN